MKEYKATFIHRSGMEEYIISLAKKGFILHTFHPNTQQGSESVYIVMERDPKLGNLE